MSALLHGRRWLLVLLAVAFVAWLGLTWRVSWWAVQYAFHNPMAADVVPMPTGRMP